MIGEPVDEGYLRTDDEEVRVEFARGRRDARQSVCRDPGVAGVTRTSALFASAHARACSRAPDPDDDAARHEVRTNCSRPGPTPTTEIVTPIRSSRKRT